MATDSHEKKLYYLVSGDLRAIVGRWLSTHSQLFLPDKQVFDKLQSALLSELGTIFNPQGVEVVYLSTEYLKAGLLMLIADHAPDIPVISLDQVYVERGLADIHFDANRIVKWSKHDAEQEWRLGWTEIGHGPRIADLSIQSQLDRIVNQGRIRRMQKKRVALVDDGTWTRGSLKAVQRLLLTKGIHVERFVVAINIEPEEGEGCYSLDAPFHWVDKYRKAQVVDWIGERDWYPGIGFSGRTVGEQYDHAQAHSEHYFAVPMEGNYGAPYVLPLGDPVEWASIPADKVVGFSIFCLEQTVKLYQEIEAESKRITGSSVRIRVQDLERPPFFLRKQKDHSIIDELSRLIDQLKKNS